MNDKTREPDASDELDAAEEAELAELVEVLKQEQYVAADEQFWARLHQSIVNQLAVTPMPKRALDAPRGRGHRVVAWITSRVPGPHWSRVALAGAALVAIVLLGVWLLSLVTPTTTPLPVVPEGYAEQATDEPEATVGTPTAPPLPVVPEGYAEPATDEPAVLVTAALDIPDELWSQGFLAHKETLLARQGMVDLAENGDSTQVQSMDWAVLTDETEVQPFGWGDPYESAGVWTLRHLTGDELQQFEQLLDG